MNDEKNSINENIEQTSFEKTLSNAINLIEDKYQKNEKNIPLQTGYSELDQLISGIYPGELALISGYDSIKETAFVMGIIDHAAFKHRLPVYILSLKLIPENMCIRMISSLGRININSLNSGRLKGSDWARITSALSLMSNVNIEIENESEIDFYYIREKL